MANIAPNAPVVRVLKGVKGLRLPILCSNCGKMVHASYRTRPAQFGDGSIIQVYYTPTYDCNNCLTDISTAHDDRIFVYTAQVAWSRSMGKVYFGQFSEEY